MCLGKGMATFALARNSRKGLKISKNRRKKPTAVRRAFELSALSSQLVRDHP
jgi:hypothetical protein